MFHERDSPERCHAVAKAAATSPFELYHFLQAFLQAAPQTMLQFYVLLREDTFRNYETSKCVWQSSDLLGKWALLVCLYMSGCWTKRMSIEANTHIYIMGKIVKKYLLKHVHGRFPQAVGVDGFSVLIVHFEGDYVHRCECVCVCAVAMGVK